MDFSINSLVRSLLQKEDLSQCSPEELQGLVTKYPYSGALQLLLTKKMQDVGQSPEQLQTNSLFFTDPLWIDHLLNETGAAQISQLAVEAEQPIENYEKEDEEEPPSPDLPVETAIKIPLPVMSKAEPGLSFEPFHTVDYFASQGIRYKPEAMPSDKLGQQLKSFTEWLKTMKRFQAAETEKAAPAAANNVDQLAEHSIKDREVITEAMAEVWAKQGNTAKSIDIYSKLSLLDPSKSAYFAAKIEGLKNKLI